MSTAGRPFYFYPAVLTVALLSIPFIAGLVSSEVHWSLSDFVIGGALVFVVTTVEMMLWRSLPKKNRFQACTPSRCIARTGVCVQGVV